MPAPFVLPANPGFGSQLGQNLGQGISQGIGASLNQFLEQKKSMGILKSLGLGVSNSSNEAGVPGISSSEPQQGGLRNLTPEQVLGATIQSPQLGTALSNIYASQQKERLAELKETKDYRDKISTQAIAARELKPTLDQMEKLAKTGKLTGPVVSRLAKEFGVVGLLNPESQQFQALSIGFLNNAKDVFGARLTNFDVQTYLDKIPQLTQNDEGKKVILDNFRVIGEAAEARKTAMNEIIKENKGRIPFDLDEQVENRAGPRLDKLAETFNRNLSQKQKSPQQVSSSNDTITMRDREGNLRKVSKKDAIAAQQAGYTLEQ